MKRRIKKSQFDNLDAMRFLAFLVIFLASAIFTSDGLIRGSNFYHDSTVFFSRISETAMSLAFILAAFLNSWAVFEERFIYKKLNITRFYIRRVLTIVPVYLLIFLIGAWILPKFDFGWLDDHQRKVDPLLYLTFLTNYSDFNLREPYSAVLGNMWSIAVYFQFIIVWPIMLRFFRKYENVLFVITIIGFIASALFMSGKENFRYSSLNILCDIAIGSYLAYFSFYKYNLYQKLKSVTPRTIGTVYILFFVSFFLYNSFWSNHFGLPDEVIFIIRRIAYGLALAFFIFEQNFVTKSVFKLSKLKIFDAPGRMVYGLYVYHALAILIGVKIAEFMGFSQGLTTYVILPFLSLILAFILAMFSYEFYEKRFIKQKSNYQPTREYTPAILNNDNSTKGIENQTKPT